MAWHPLDGNMIAADAYYGRGKTPEIGDKCAHCAEGYLAEPDDGTDDDPLVCNECGEVA